MVTSNKGSATQISEYEAARKRRDQEQKYETPTRRTSAGLRDALFDEIDALRRGDGDPQRATAVARLAINIIASAKLDLDFHKAGLPPHDKIKPVLLAAPSDEPEPEVGK